MKEKTSIGSKILFVVLLILSLAWVYPIFMILNNSFKTDRFITTRTVFDLPASDSFAGIANFVNALTSKRICKSIWLQPVNHNHIGCVNPDLLLYVRMVYYKSKWYRIKDFVFPLCIFYGCTISDADVYVIINSR